MNASFDRIVIVALIGNDSITVEPPITKPTVIDGEQENDAKPH